MEVPHKKARTEQVMCIICTKMSPVSEITKPKDANSIETLLEAARIQNYHSIVDMEPSDYDTKLCYHRNCRSTFTLKKTLEKFKVKTEESKPTERKSTRELHSSSSTVLQEICIFCGKTSKYVKGTKTREVLHQSRELRSDEKVRRAAMNKMNDKILAITSRELVAAEAHYHNSCYRNFTRGEKSEAATPSVENNEQQLYQQAVQNAYNMLFQHVRNTLFSAPEVIKLTSLTEMLVNLMSMLGYIDDEVLPQTKKQIRRRLESEFGESLHFVKTAEGKVLIYPDNLTMESLAKENNELKNQLESVSHECEVKAVLTKSASHIRSDIKNMKKKPWPPQPDQLTADYMKLPDSLEIFLRVLLTGDVKQSVPSSNSREHRLVESLGQDFVYTVSGGSIIPAKHILLPWSVKSLTGNVELIQMLNRLGHGMSYSKLVELDTTLCLQKQAMTAADDVILPSNVHPIIPTTLAFDNIDRLEETLSGGGTSHRVNGIIVQPQVSTALLIQDLPKVVPSKKRSITPVPLEIPDYNAGERVGPPITHAVALNFQPVVQDAHNRNLLWSSVRQMNTSDQSISSWTGFNMQARDNITVRRDTVGYLPTVNAPATQLSTVHEVLNQALKIQKKLNLGEIVCVFDQALYAKAAEITWKHDEMNRNIVLRMGVFHTLCNLLSIIGKRFSSAGLRDISVESGIIAEGSVNSVLEGRNYNRGVRLCKLVYEALLRLAWKGFYVWLEEHHADDLPHLTGMTRALDPLVQETVNNETVDAALADASCARVFNLFDTYLDHLRFTNGQLATFWMSFIDIVENLLALIRSSREGNWMLHLSAIKSMIPWGFAYDKQNYARYLSIYYSQMTQLAETHPDVHDHFQHGGFSVQLGDHNPFGRIPVDQTIEETINKDTQTAGGTKGFSLKAGAISKYYINAEYRSLCLKQLRSMTQVGNIGKSHVDLTPSRIRKDEKAVQSLAELMENNWTNPLGSEPSELVSLSTGATAPPDVANDLITAKQRGEQAYTAFQECRIEQTKCGFFEKIPRLQLKTFASIKQKVTKKTSNKEVILKTDHKLFGHMVLVASSRKVEMKEVLQYPLGPLPWSLANCDGTLKKTNKAALARKLEANVSSAEEIPQPSACIIDGMSLIQKTNGDNMTFDELADQIHASVMRAAASSERVDVVFDVYKQMSIKDAERATRGSDTGIRFTNILSGHKIQQWRRLLCCGASKMKLVQFIVDQWQETRKRQILGEKVMYVTSGETCTKITCDEVVEIDELKTSQEEADTRILLHAKHASPDVSSVVIVAEDTDVFILSLAFHDTISCNIFIKCGTKTRTRYIDVSKVAISVGKDVCHSLPGMHAFTGCDTVSAFSGRGKVGALKLLKGHSKYQQAFTQLGENWTVSSEVKDCLEEFVCRLYVPKSDIISVNEMRYQLFRTKDGNVESGQLPPCQDCLEMHTIRANYQSAIWHRSLDVESNTPSPLDCTGWIVNDEAQLQVNWMTGSPAPDVVLEFLSCKCKHVCRLPDCQCMVNGLKCTDACRLQSCDNMKDDEDIMSNEGQMDDISDDDGDSDHDDINVDI